MSGLVGASLLFSLSGCAVEETNEDLIRSEQEAVEYFDKLEEQKSVFEAKIAETDLDSYITFNGKNFAFDSNIPDDKLVELHNVLCDTIPKHNVNFDVSFSGSSDLSFSTMGCFILPELLDLVNLLDMEESNSFSYVSYYPFDSYSSYRNGHVDIFSNDFAGFGVIKNNLTKFESFAFSGPFATNDVLLVDAKYDFYRNTLNIDVIENIDGGVYEGNLNEFMVETILGTVSFFDVQTYDEVVVNFPVVSTDGVFLGCEDVISGLAPAVSVVGCSEQEYDGSLLSKKRCS